MLTMALIVTNNALQSGLHWWNTWQEQSANRRIFAAMVTVGGFTVLAKFAAVLKDVVVAGSFGTSDDLDAFLIAMVLPSFATGLIAGSFNFALIPSYIQVREKEGWSAAQRVLSSVMVLTVGLLVAVSAILAASASYVLPFLASGFSPEKLALTQALYYMLLPTLVLSGLTIMWGALLNAENRFAFPAVVPMATSVLTVIAVFGFAKHWGGYALAAGAVCGALIETGLLGWALARRGVSLRLRWCGVCPAVRKVFSQYSPMLAAALLMGSATVVSQSIAAMLGPGSVSTLAYGSKVTSLILGIGGTAVNAAILPHFSSMVARENWHGLRHTVFTYARLLLLITLPTTLVLIYFSEPVVAMLFQRGAFTEADSHLVGRVQALCVLQVPIYIVSRLFVGLIPALKATHLMMWGNVINLSMCIALNYILMQWLAVEGIALATSLMYLISLCFVMWVSLRLINQRIGAHHESRESI